MSNSLLVLAVLVIAIVLAVWIVAQLVAAARRALINAAKRRVGENAEQLVAAGLSVLGRRGHYYVFNGLQDRSPRGRGDIDHLVIGPPGIFVVETKGARAQVSADHSYDPPLLLRDGRPFTENGDPRPKSFLHQLDREISEIHRNVLNPYKDEYRSRNRRRSPWILIEGRVCFPRGALVPDSRGKYPPRTLTLDELVDEIASYPRMLGADDIDLLADIARKKYGKSPAVAP